MGVILLLGVAALVAAILCGLAIYWSHTPHGRLKPIFALAFRLAGILRPGDVGNELGTRQMAGTPEQRAGARRDFLKNVAGLAKRVPFVGEIEDRMLPGKAGDIPVRIYRPAGAGPLPVVVYLHGGGFVVGSIEYTDGVTRALAMQSPAVVISVDYRLAPEHVCPAALDDAESVVAWAAEHAASIGGRPQRVTVAGDSAGGNLAAALALRDVAAGAGRIALQVLIYPAVDGTSTERGSYQHFGVGYGLSRQAVEDCIALYVPDPAQRRHPDASPLLAPSHAGLAPAFVITAGFDVLRDEGIEYAERLQKAGVRVRHLHQPHLPHGFITMNRLCREAGATIEEIAAEVRSVAAQLPAS